MRQVARLGPICEACGQPLPREDLLAEQNLKHQGEREAR